MNTLSIKNTVPENLVLKYICESSLITQLQFLCSFLQDNFDSFLIHLLWQ